jgi:hypothetical protein
MIDRTRVFDPNLAWHCTQISVHQAEVSIVRTDTCLVRTDKH